MNTPLELQETLQDWDGAAPPPRLDDVLASPGYTAMRPAARIQALNQTQRNAANWIRTNADAYGVDYGDTARAMEQDFNTHRRKAVEAGLAEDLSSGSLTDAQVKTYVQGGAAALDDEFANYARNRYGADTDVAGPWTTQKIHLAGADGKAAGYAYVRRAPGNEAQAEVSWGLNAKDGQIKGTDIVDLAAERKNSEAMREMIPHYRSPGKDVTDSAALLDLPADQQPLAFAQRGIGSVLRGRPDIVKRMGQGGFTAFAGEAAKGFLELGAAVRYGPAALFGDKQAARDYAGAREDMGSDIEGMSRAGFAGGLWNDVAKGLAREAIPTALSMGTGAAASAAREALTTAVQKKFAERFLALEMENLAKSGAQTMATRAGGAAPEMLGKAAAGAGTSLPQELNLALSRGFAGKVLGTAPLESAAGKMLADRVVNGLAFLPNSARSGLDNIITTLNAAESARAGGDEKKAQELEDNAIMNGWAGTAIETLSENLWLNEMVVTRAGHSLSHVAGRVLERQMKPGVFNTLKQRAVAALKAVPEHAAKEGVEENVAGVGGRAWMNEFAAQNTDLLEGAGTEFITGAIMGAMMAGAKELAQNNKPHALAELTRRGLDGDPEALASLARIRAAAEKLPGKQPARENAGPPAGTLGEAQGAPAAAVPAVVAGAAAPGAASTDAPGSIPSTPGAVTRLPGLLDAPATPGTASEAPSPDSPATVDEQIRLARAADSTRAAVLFTPGTAVPAKRPHGLQQATTQHGTVWFNPDKTTREAVAAAGQAEVFDASLLGQSGQPAGPGSLAITANTPAAPNIQAELVPEGRDPAAAIEAATAAAPGAKIEVKPAAQVLDERASIPEASRIAGDPAENKVDTGNDAAPRVQFSKQLDTTAPAGQRLPMSNSEGAAQQQDSTPPGGLTEAKLISNPKEHAFREGEPVIFKAWHGSRTKHKKLRTSGDLDNTQAAGAYLSINADKARGYKTPDILAWQPVQREEVTFKENAPGEWLVFMRGRAVGVTRHKNPQTAGAWLDSVRNEKVEFYNRMNGHRTDKVQPQGALDEFWVTFINPVVGDAADWARKKGLNYEDMTPYDVRKAMIKAGHDGQIDVKSGDEQVIVFHQRSLSRKFPIKTAAPVSQSGGSTKFNDSTAPSHKFQSGPAFSSPPSGITIADFPDALSEQPLPPAVNEQSPAPAPDAERVPFSKPQGLLFRRDGPQRRAAPTAKHAADAVQILRDSAPEVLRSARVVATADELNPNDYHPDDWAEIAGGRVEGFYNPATGETIVIAANVVPRAGESAISAVGRVILHEQLGHHGLRLALSDPAFRKTWESIMNDIPAEELAALLPLYPELAEEPERLAEEWFARQAEAAKAAPGSPARRAWEAFKAWVAKVWGHFAQGTTPLSVRVKEALDASRRALASAAPPSSPESLQARLAAGIPVRASNALIVPPNAQNVDKSVRAYHGTPHAVDKFSTEKIGTGEGAQAYGWGIYFAEARAVAEEYRNTLTNGRVEGVELNSQHGIATMWLNYRDKHPEEFNASLVDDTPDGKIIAGILSGKIRRASGNLYTVELLPDAEDFLDWDKPLSEQSEKVQAAIKNLLKEHRSFNADPTTRMSDKGKDGESLYHMLVRKSGSEKAASEMLAALGIPGIRYLDGNSRDGGKGTANYVVFDENNIRITEQNGERVQFSRAPGSPVELRDLPEWIKAKLKVKAVSAFTVKNQTMRTMLRGDALPKGWTDVLTKAGHETAAVVGHMATLSLDMKLAMKQFAKATGTDMARVERAVQLALTGNRTHLLPTKALQETTLAVRNFLDQLSDEVALITGGTLGQAILDNKGHWMRRSYMAFDPDAEWNYDALDKAAAAGKLYHGRDARAILNRARTRLQAEHPHLTGAGIEALMRDLTDREALLGGIAGGPSVNKDVSSLMRRRQIPRDIRELMGEVKNPLANVLASASFQAQFIARHDQQQILASTGLATGLFTTAKEGRYTQRVGGEEGDGNLRWSGFFASNSKNERVALYTTPELWQAMQNAPSMGAADIGRGIMDTIQTLSGFAKANKVALSPDSAAPQYFGNVVSMVMNGDLLWADGYKNIAEAVRLYQSGKGDLAPVNKALLETRRQLLAQMAAHGLTSSLSQQDLEVTMDTAMLRFAEGNRKWDKSLGALHGGLLGQAFGRPFGTTGRIVGGAAGAVGGAVVGETNLKHALQFVAQWVVGHPDRIGKMASFLTNFQHQLASGQNRNDAFQTAAEKTLNTMPDYSKVPHLLRSLSKFGMVQSFVAFKYELVRNTFWNLRYAAQEVRSGNPAMMARGARRLMGTAAVYAALRWGLPALVQGLFGSGADDDKDRAYRKWLAAPWEKYANLNYSALDRDHASFFNASYLIPQSMFLEIANLAKSDTPLDDLGDKIWQDFAEGNVHLDPLMEIYMNAHKGAPEQKVTFKTGWPGLMEKLDYYMKKVLEPGAAEKADRIQRALTGRNTASRTFSIQEEALRLGGFRSYTYRHEPRVKGALYRFKDEREDIASEAKSAWHTNQTGARDTAIAHANTRLEQLQTRYQEFLGDMEKLGLRPMAEKQRRETGYRPQYRLTAGKDGPQSTMK